MSICSVVRLAGALLMACFAVAGCGSTSPSGGSNTATTARARFPVSVHGPGGVTVLARAPDRIVSLSPTSTEDLFAIGAGSEVVAVDGLSDYPKNAPRTKLSGFQPNVEAIANYRPDLVVISDESPTSLAPALRQLHIPVLIGPAARSLKQAYVEIEQLGEATGRVAQARALVSGMQSRVAASVRSVKGEGQGLGVYDEISQEYYAAASSTPIGQLFGLFGLRDIADRAPDPHGLGYPQLSDEYIVSSNPDIVFLTDTLCCGQTAASVARRPGWSHMTAVRKRTIVAFNEDIASRWGPRTATLAQEIAHAIESAHTAGL
jgi:iron complex transport system substrate-binding protein